MKSPVSIEVRDRYLAMPWPDRARRIARYPADFDLLTEEDRHQVLLRHGSDLVFARLRSMSSGGLARTLAEHPDLLAHVGSVGQRRMLLSILSRVARTTAAPSKPSFANELVTAVAWGLAAAIGTGLPLFLLLKGLMSYA